MSEISTIAQSLLIETTYPVVLATLVHVEGSSYRRAGARRLIASDGSAIGSISGGCLENDIQERAVTLLETVNRFELVIYDTKSENDILWGTGTGCHGVVKVLLEKMDQCPSWAEKIWAAENSRQNVAINTIWEISDQETSRLGTSLAENSGSAQTGTFGQTISPSPHVIIFGAGDDAISVSRLIRATGWKNSICDPRANFATSGRFPTADKVLCIPAEEAVSQFDWDDKTMAVVMTHHYRFDLPLLTVLVPMNLPFLGLLGPKERGARLLRDAKIPLESANLHNPIGLDLGGDGPEAVALSIVAEIQANLHGRDGQPLRNRTQPIHES